MKYLLLLALVAIATIVHAQTVYEYVEWMPKAGYDFNKYFAKNFHYPDSVKQVVSRIVVKFIVNEDGSIDSVQVVKGIEIKDEVLKVIQNMPKWSPGKQNGKLVKVRYTLPISIHPE